MNNCAFSTGVCCKIPWPRFNICPWPESSPATSSVAEITVNVSGYLKLGNLDLSFTDLSIPVAGIPITIKDAPPPPDSRERAPEAP